MKSTMKVTLLSGATVQVRTSCDFAYVLQSDGLDGIVKVGRSHLPKQRFSTIRSGVPFALKEIAIMGDGEKREAELKRLLEPFHVKGEWFRPSEGLNQYLASTYKAGGVLVCKTLNAEFVDEYIRPAILEHLAERTPAFNDSGNLLYRYLHVGYPALEGQLTKLLTACANTISPELINGFVSAPIAGHPPQVRIPEKPPVRQTDDA